MTTLTRSAHPCSCVESTFASTFESTVVSASPPLCIPPYLRQADDMTFDANKNYLYIACGNAPGLTYANRVVALKSTDNWATAEVVWTAKSGCASVAAAAFIGSDLYNICFLFDTHVYKHTLASFLVPLSTGAIVAIVVAAVAVLVIMLAAIKYFMGKKMPAEKAKAAPTMTAMPDAQGV